MVRTKKNSRFKYCCLILLILLPITVRSQDFKLGELTQSQGDITFLNYQSPYTLEQVQKSDVLKEEGSYLTHENAHFTGKLFDGTWLRASPRSKFALEFNPESRVMTLHLFAGSVKILFTSLLNDKKIDKFLVKSADSILETSEAKFTVVRNILTAEVSVFVEKGLVIGRFDENSQNKPQTLVHTKEMSFLHDRSWKYSDPVSMGDRELKFLKSTFYLGGKQTDEMD